MSPKLCLTLGAVFGFLAVLLGAFGAHGLGEGGKAEDGSRTPGYLEQKYADTEDKNVAGLSIPVSHKYLEDFRTGVRYHMWHAIAMLITGLVMLRQPSRLLSAAAWCFAAGIVLFSGALYVLVICGPKAGGITWGLVAPLGGTLQLIAWLMLAIGVARADFSPVGDSRPPTA